MGLTYYPIEDVTILRTFREQMSPFMKAIQKTTRGIWYNTIFNQSESIFDEIINAARSYNGDDQLSAEWYQYIRDTSNQTLGKEHDGLIAANLE